MAVANKFVSDAWLYNCSGKGRKMRIVPLRPKTVAILKEYMQEHALLREDCLNQPLFSNRYGQRLSCSGKISLPRGSPIGNSWIGCVLFEIQ